MVGRADLAVGQTLVVFIQCIFGVSKAFISSFDGVILSCEDLLPYSGYTLVSDSTNGHAHTYIYALGLLTSTRKYDPFGTTIGFRSFRTPYGHSQHIRST